MANQPWPSQRIQNLDRSLKKVADLVRKPAPDEPDEVTQALARFLVVRTCGHLEKVAQECCLAYVDGKSGHRVNSFARSWLARLNGPTPDRLLDLVARFDAALESDLKEVFTANDHEVGRAISLLVNKRNLIAHGGSEGVGSRKALDLLGYERTVSDWFVRNFDPR